MYWDAFRSDSVQNADSSAASDLQTGATSRSRPERSRAHDPEAEEWDEVYTNAQMNKRLTRHQSKL